MTSSDPVIYIPYILALLGLVVGPTIAYFAAKYKVMAEVRLIDINTIKSWSEARKAFEKEISALHAELSVERAKRREERKKYLKQLDELEKKLRKTEVCLAKYKLNG